MMAHWLRRNWPLLAAHVGGWYPLASLLLDAGRGRLTANPIQYITLHTGKPALVLLVLCLACTPVDRFLAVRPALRVRKLLGLYAFGYATLHFFIFAVIDYGLDVWQMLNIVAKKPYALVGFSALLALLPLALTSTRGWQQRLGSTWKKLHRLVYVAGLLAVTHYIWLVKSDVRQPLLWAAAVGLLLLARLRAASPLAAATRAWVRRQLARVP